MLLSWINAPSFPCHENIIINSGSHRFRVLFRWAMDEKLKNLSASKLIFNSAHFAMFIILLSGLSKGEGIINKESVSEEQGNKLLFHAPQIKIEFHWQTRGIFRYKKIIVFCFRNSQFSRKT